jgi:hypothetical protein
MAGAIAFIVTYGLLASSGYSLPVALGGAVVATVIMGAAGALVSSPSRAEVENEQYDEESERRLREVGATINRMRLASADIQDAPFKQLVGSICNDLEELLRTVRVKTPHSVLSTATTLYAYMPTLDAVLTRYLALQRDPRLADDAAAEMQTCRDALAQFQQGFLIKGLRSANQGDEFAFKVALKELQASEHRSIG